MKYRSLVITYGCLAVLGLAACNKHPGPAAPSAASSHQEPDAKGDPDSVVQPSPIQASTTESDLSVRRANADQFAREQAKLEQKISELRQHGVIVGPDNLSNAYGDVGRFPRAWLFPDERQLVPPDSSKSLPGPGNR